MSDIIPLFSRALGSSDTADSASKPSLILLHGLLGSSRNWQTAGTDLASRYRVFALDLRNHGRSPHAAEMTYAAMMDDVLAWMDAQAIAQTTLLGHSMGGKVAMLLACRHPDRVARLIVVDIAPKDYTAAAHRAEFAAMNELDLRTLASRGEAELRFETRIAEWSMRKFLATNLERDETTQSWKWLINLPVLTETLPQIESNPLTEYDAFAGPTELINGGRSPYVLREDWPTIQRHFPAAKSTLLSESGHNPHMETREAFVRAVFGSTEN